MSFPGLLHSVPFSHAMNGNNHHNIAPQSQEQDQVQRQQLLFQALLQRFANKQQLPQMSQQPSQPSSQQAALDSGYPQVQEINAAMYNQLLVRERAREIHQAMLAQQQQQAPQTMSAPNGLSNSPYQFPYLSPAQLEAQNEWAMMQNIHLDGAMQSQAKHMNLSPLPRPGGLPQSVLPGVPNDLASRLSSSEMNIHHRQQLLHLVAAEQQKQLGHALSLANQASFVGSIDAVTRKRLFESMDKGKTNGRRKRYRYQCQFQGCDKTAKGGGFCIGHGGGKRCVLTHCDKVARFAGSLCHIHRNATLDKDQPKTATDEPSKTVSDSEGGMKSSSGTKQESDANVAAVLEKANDESKKASCNTEELHTTTTIKDNNNEHVRESNETMMKDANESNEITTKSDEVPNEQDLKEPLQQQEI